MTLAIGLFAAALTIFSFIAQVVKIVKTGDTKSLSLPMWILSTVSFGVWVYYGIRTDQWPVIAPNAVCALLAAFILGLKLKS